MTKFLKDGKKLTKQNFAGTLAEYRLAVKGEIDKTGKTEYQILMEQREKNRGPREIQQRNEGHVCRVERGRKKEGFLQFG
jgi:hypothetical protein